MVKVGYFTGLLPNRRTVKESNLDSLYKGNTSIHGDMHCMEDQDDGLGAFRACLDVGPARTPTRAER